MAVLLYGSAKEHQHENASGIQWGVAISWEFLLLLLHFVLPEKPPFHSPLFKFSLGRRVFSVYLKGYSFNKKKEINKVCEILPIDPLTFSLIELLSASEMTTLKVI